MFRSLLIGVATLALAASSAVAQNVTLKAGDDAPELTDLEWLQGDPITEFKEGEVYVLDFWATWCGPCVAGVPHMDELHEKYKSDNVNIVGIAVASSQNNEEFIKERGEGMSYPVAHDPTGKTSDAFTRAAGIGGIPAFIVIDREGKVAWTGSGYPNPTLDTVIVLLAKDKFSIEEFAELEERKAELYQEITAAMSEQNWAKVESAMTEIVELESGLVPQFAPYIYVAKVKQDKDDEARKYVADLMTSVLKSDVVALDGLAWTIVGTQSPLEGDEVDADLAISVAERAIEIDPENASATDTLARAYFVNDEIDKAIETQRRAVELADDRFKSQFQSRLDEYESAAEAR